MREQGRRFWRRGTGSAVRLVTCLAVAGFLLGLSVPAAAHRVNVFAYLEGDTVQVESSFAGGGPVRQGKVVVLDAQGGQELLTGETNAQGKFSFPLPPAAVARKADLRIVIEASMGHQGEWLLKAATDTTGKSPTAPAAAAPASAAPPAAPKPAAAPAGAGDLNRQVVEEVVNQALDAKLAPLKQMLIEAQSSQPTLRDIIGGLGYIIGLCGLAAYLYSRKPKGS